MLKEKHEEIRSCVDCYSPACNGEAARNFVHISAAMTVCLKAQNLSCGPILRAVGSVRLCVVTMFR